MRAQNRRDQLRADASSGPEREIATGYGEPAVPELDELRFRTLFSSVPLGILLTDARCNVIDVNPVLISLFDLGSEDEARSLNAARHRPLRESGLIDYIKKCARDETPLVSEGVCTTAGGDEIYIRYYLSPIQPNPRRKPLVQTIVADLSSIKNHEKRLRRIYDYFNGIVSSMSPILTFDEGQRIQFANQPFLQEFRIDSDPAGRDLFEVLPMERKDRQQFLANLNESRGRRLENCEFALGSKTNRQIFGYSIFRFDGEIGIIVKDITRMKKLEERVSELHTRLLSAQESERQVVAGELHDGVGQTILAAKLNLSAYEKNPDVFHDRFAVGMELIDRASQELREIYTMLFPQVLNDLGLEAALRWYSKNFLELKNIRATLNIRLRSQLPRDVQTQLFRVVQEIFTNIVKHSRASEARLTLEEDEGLVRIVVEDDGAGFQPEKARLKGRGFGLYTMQRRVQDLDGRLEIRSRPGEGTRFEIEIPFAEGGT